MTPPQRDNPAAPTTEARHGPNDGCAELLWAHVSADPGFDEELRQARTDIAEGHGVPLAEYHTEEFGPSPDTRHLPARSTPADPDFDNEPQPPALSKPATDPAAPTTPDDRKVYEELTGFTDHDIEIIARAVGVSDDTVYRLIDCIRFVKGQGLSEQRVQTARSTPAEALDETARENWRDAVEVLRDALDVQRTGCDHEGIGRPGCRTCDPRTYAFHSPGERPMKPSTRRALALLLSKEWVHGNELFQVAGTRYGGRLDELKALGYTWDKQWRPGSAVPWYRIHAPRAPEKSSKRPAVAPGQMALPGSIR